MSFKVAIAGITSKLAQRIAAEILFKHPDAQIYGSSRDASKLSSIFKESSRITLINSGPYDTSTLRTLVRGADVVICCYFADNETMLNGQKLLIDLCEDESVPRYIASDYTLDFRGLEFGDVPMKDPMKHIQAYLETKKVVKGVHVLVGMFMETFWTAFGVLDAERKTFRYWGDGSVKFEMTSTKGVAEYVAAVALDPKAVGFFKFRGDRKSMLEIASELEIIYGSKLTLETYESLESVSPVQRMLEDVSSLLKAGKLGLGDEIDNDKYPGVRPETISNFLKDRSMEQLVEGESNVQAQIDLVRTVRPLPTGA